MKDKGKKPGKAAAESLPILAPGDAVLLEQQVAGLEAALAAGEEPEVLLGLVERRPQDPAWDLHLLARLAQLSHPDLPALLGRLFGAAPDKARRKALQRALHILKSKGLAVDAALLPRPEPTVLKFTKEPVVAHLSHIFSLDGNEGERYVVLEGPAEVLGGSQLVARLSDRRGFRELHVMSLRRKQWAEFWEYFRSHGLDEWAKAPPAYALRLLEEAWALNPSVEGRGRRYGALRERLHQRLGPPEAAPTLATLLPALPDADRRGLLERSWELSRDSLFFSWLPGPDQTMPWYQKMLDSRSSPLVLTEQQHQDRLDAVVEDAVQAFYPPESRPFWGRRLLEIAYFLDLKGRTEEARAAQAAGEDLFTGTAGPLTGENPFLKSLSVFALTMAAQLAAAPDQPQKPSGLVLPPSSLFTPGR
ncbi:MAG: hypothetical protein FJ128_00920 [Deltaproteobacteria bacterium]|nr:hypothetical protein [Deltaproteobacteria bacterium]